MAEPDSRVLQHKRYYIDVFYWLILNKDSAVCAPLSQLFFLSKAYSEVWCLGVCTPHHDRIWMGVDIPYHEVSADARVFMACDSYPLTV